MRVIASARPRMIVRMTARVRVSARARARVRVRVNVAVHGVRQEGERQRDTEATI